MIIEIKDVYYTYPNGVEAIRGVSLTIEYGERVAIVGQNGAGKTTLVKHMNGLVKPSKGTVLVGGWNTKDRSVAKMASRVGYVFQNPDTQLFSPTVEEEVEFGPKNLGFEAEKVKRLVDSSLETTGLQDQRRVNPYDLSPTWRKMVALASILAMDNPVVILDEPTTGQDAIHVRLIGSIVDQLNQRGKTVITISHDIDFCVEHFNRIVVMGQGQVLLDGPVLEIITQEEILATTFVDPPQLTRLGKALGLDQPVYTRDGFLDAYQLARQRGDL